MDTKLHEAVRYCDVDGVVNALKENFNPNSVGLLKWTPVQEAAKSGERDILFYLLQHGGDPNIRDGLSGGNTALHFAAQEGHVDCLRLLLKHGGHATLLNSEGFTCAQVAPPEMTDAVEKLIMEFGGEGQQGEEENNNERKLIRRPAPTDTDKWNTLPEVPRKAEMGYLHLSFEYHKGMLKVRVWQISDLLLPPPQISMIHSIFVRGYFMPDKVKKTLRRTEDIVVDTPVKGAMETPRTGIQHIFTPSSFKFSTPLLYTGVTGEMVKERSLQLEVCMTQKASHRVFLMAMVHMPLRAAVRRPIRQKYPLIPCMNVTIPNNMRVYSAAELHLESSKGGDFNHHRGRVANGDGRDPPVTARDVDLEDVVSLSGEDFLRSHLSLCLDSDGSDDDRPRRGSDEGGLREVRVANGIGSGGSSTATLNMPSSDDDVDDDDDVPDVVTHSGESSIRSTPIDMRSVDSGSTSSTSGGKKRIIPNEVVAASPVDGAQDVTVEMPAEETVVDLEGALNEPPPVSSPSRAKSPPSKPPRKKIIPVGVETPVKVSSSGSEVLRSEDTRLDVTDPEVSDGQGRQEQRKDSQGKPNRDVSGGASQKKKKIMVLPGEISIPSDSLPHPTTSKLSSTDSDGLSPCGRSDSELSPMPDSAFTPVSRPETPCWDFYDFAEDLQPEEDMEATNRALEASLAQLRLQGAEGVSKEPILPMVLVDDFDTLAVDPEHADNLDD